MARNKTKPAMFSDSDTAREVATDAVNEAMDRINREHGESVDALASEAISRKVMAAVDSGDLSEAEAHDLSGVFGFEYPVDAENVEGDPDVMTEYARLALAISDDISENAAETFLAIVSP